MFMKYVLLIVLQIGYLLNNLTISQRYHSVIIMDEKHLCIILLSCGILNIYLCVYLKCSIDNIINYYYYVSFLNYLMRYYQGLKPFNFLAAVVLVFKTDFLIHKRY